MFTKVIVPLDGSALAEQAIEPAIAIAGAAGATLTLLLVHKPVPFAGFGDAPWNVDEQQAERTYLATVERNVAHRASALVTSAVLHGDPAEQIAEYAREHDAGMIVMTTHGRTGFSRAWLGSVAHAVLRRSYIPVFLVRPASDAPRPADHVVPKRVLVTLDGSELSRAVVEPAITFARAAKAGLVFLRVVEPVPLPEMTRQLVADAQQDFVRLTDTLAAEGFTDLTTDVVVADGVARAILDYATAHEIDGIAMSTHGRGLSQLLLGSVADKVLRASELPMLLQRPLEVQSASRLLDEASVVEQLPALSGL